MIVWKKFCYSGFTPDDIKRKIPPRIKASGSMIPIITVPTPTFRLSPLNSSFVSSPVKKTLAFAHSCILLCIFYALFISALISFSFLYLLFFIIKISSINKSFMPYIHWGYLLYDFIMYSHRRRFYADTFCIYDHFYSVHPWLFWHRQTGALL